MKQFKKLLLLCCCIGVLGSMTACGRKDTMNSATQGTTNTSEDVVDKNSNSTTGSGTNTTTNTTTHETTEGTTNSTTKDTTMHDTTDGDGVLGNTVNDVVDGVDNAVHDITDGNARTQTLSLIHI